MSDYIADALKFALDSGYVFPTLTSEGKRHLADELEGHAKALRLEAHWQRPLPDFWRVGQTVLYLTHSKWGWDKGNTGVVIDVEQPTKPAEEYQVFFTNVDGREHPRFWTTPDDVELISED